MARIFPAVSAPPIQQTLATAEYGSDANPVMSGTTQPGAFGFAWHKVVLTKTGNVVTWAVDDNLIATYDATSLGSLGGNNLALGVSDVNNTTARHPSLEFTVFDNLTVSSITPPGVAGDYNGNGVVDMADYVLWQERRPTAERSEQHRNGRCQRLHCLACCVRQPLGQRPVRQRGGTGASFHDVAAR